jgi:4-carboxymuconolactone decarboxylase
MTSVPEPKDINDPNEQERHRRGLEVVAQLDQKAAQAVFDSLATTSPALVHTIVAWAFGDIYARPALSPQERQLITLGILTALGGTESQLAFHIRAARKLGFSQEKIAEIFLHAAVYAGIPRAMNATLTAKGVFQDEDQRH